MKTQYSNLSSKHVQAVAALREKLQDARAALGSQHSVPELPAAPPAALVPMPPASMHSTSAVLAPATSEPRASIDVEATEVSVDAAATTAESAGESSAASGSEELVLHPAHEREFEQLEARSERLEKELAVAEAHLKGVVREAGAAGPPGTSQGAAPRAVCCFCVHTEPSLHSWLLAACTTLFRVSSYSGPGATGAGDNARSPCGDCSTRKYEQLSSGNL